MLSFKDVESTHAKGKRRGVRKRHHPRPIHRVIDSEHVFADQSVDQNPVSFVAERADDGGRMWRR